MTISNCRRLMLVALSCMAGGTLANATTLGYRAVWYRPVRGCIWKQLADNHPPPSGEGTESPRVIALKTLDQNFYGYSLMNANAVVVGLPEEDSAESQRGCGFPYDPVQRPCNLNNGTCNYPAIPAHQYSVAQELFISVAAKWNLKVIFVLPFSGYHKEMDPAHPPTPACPSAGCDTYGNASSPAGAWDYIHSVIDPPAYYGRVMTAGLTAANIGLTDHYTTDYFADSRIAGWILGMEWRFSITKEANFLRKYWGYFYSLVHFPGSVGQFAGLYIIGGPDVRRTNNSCSVPLPASNDFSDFKSFFASETHKPDLWGLEWYGNGTYNLDCIATDMASMVSHLQNDPPNTVTITPSQIAWIEGGSDQNSPADRWQNLYTQGIDAAANTGTAGLVVWDSDPIIDLSSNGTCSYTSVGGIWSSVFSVAYPITNYSQYSFYQPVFCGPVIASQYSGGGYPPPSVGWHWYHYDDGSGNSHYTLESGYSVPTTVGPIWYSMRTQAGDAVEAAFLAHR